MGRFLWVHKLALHVSYYFCLLPHQCFLDGWPLSDALLCSQVQERVENRRLGTPGQGTPHSSPHPSMDPHNQLSSQTTHAPAIHEPRSNHRHLRPDDLWKISCNNTLLPPNVTLAVVRKYVWRQSGEVVLDDRRKRWLCIGRTRVRY